MKVNIVTHLLLVFLFSLSTQNNLLTFPTQHKLKVTFGSCNKFYESDNSTIFNAIADYKPDLWIWLGDVAYVEDMELYYLQFKFPGVEIARRRLENSKNDPAYQKLRKTTPIIGTWDNHDYGADGGDKTFPHKYEMKEAFLDFLDEPRNTPRRNRHGVYESYTINLGGLKINFILLDVRFNKDQKNYDMLGEDQWKWLETELQKRDDIYFIGSGSQVLPDDRILHDNWFPQSNKKLVQLIQKYNIAAIILSGDVHLAEVISLPCSKDLLGYQLYEITSSGLTHTSRDHFPKGELFDKLFFPETYNKGEDRFVDYNFGSIEIEANESNKNQSKISLQIRDITGTVILIQDLTLGDLQRAYEPKSDINSFKYSLCFNSLREERFLKHLFKAILNPTIFLWLSASLLILSAFLFIICYSAYKICAPKKKKLKFE